jgi:hypothetical protein
MDIKITFADFWPNFKYDDNYFYNLLSTKYNVTLDDQDPDILFFSVDYSRRRERERYKNHRCKKIFFTGENVRPHFDDADSIEYPRYSVGKCDFAFTFDYMEDERNYRFPLWAFFMNWFNRPYDANRDPAYLVPVNNVLQRNVDNKPYFCNFLFQNTSGERLNILDTIQMYKPVMCAGNLRNNAPRIGGRGDQKEKIDFISQFKFTIASENSKYDGYTTEKMIHPMSVGSIPIYWGSDRVTEEFNEKAFVNANKLSGQELLNRIIEINEDDGLYQSIISEPVFPNNEIPSHVLPENVLRFFEKQILC